MKVTMIGTGAMYTAYNSACTLINEELLLDIPNGTVKQLLKMGYVVGNIRYFVITHLHGDHVADFPFLMKYLYVHEKDKKKIAVVGPKGIKRAIEELFEAYHFEDREKIADLCDVEYLEVEDGKKLNLGNYQIEVKQVDHAEELAFGYCINNILGYTGDTMLCKGVEEIYRKSKVTIADTSFLKEKPGHMGIAEIEYLIQKENKPIIPTHMRDETRHELKNLKNERIWLMEDNTSFEL